MAMLTARMPGADCAMDDGDHRIAAADGERSDLEEYLKGFYVVTIDN